MPLATQAKKLVSVLVTSLLVIESNIAVQNQKLERVLYIQYLIKFKKGHIEV